MALVADVIVNEPPGSFDVLGLLEAAGFGLVVLPPADFVLRTIARIVEYTVDDLEDYRANGYRVVIVGSSRANQFGVWLEHVGHEVAKRAIEPFELFDIVGATQESFQRFLGASVPAALNCLTEPRT